MKLKVNTYKTIILPVVLYGCETWSLTLREEHRLRVFENKVGPYLGRYLGLREMKLQENGESYIMLSYMHCILRLTLLGILNRDDRDGQDMYHIWSNSEMHRVLVGKPESKRPLGRPRCRWEENIKMELREVVCDPRDWIALAEDSDQWRAYVRE